MNLSTEETSIDDLPLEMVWKLFKNLNLKDLIACSMVNKCWHSIYMNFKVHRLSAIGYVRAHCDHRPGVILYYPNRIVEDKELCSPELFNRLADKPLLSNLKQLALCGQPSQFDLEKLNTFSQLVHLEIKTLKLGRNELNLHVNLKLPKLKFLSLNQLKYRCITSIDCPELNVLIYPGQLDYYEEYPWQLDYVDLMNVKHPETIKKLHTDWAVSQLARFQNVECLTTRRFGLISTATLLSLPRLKDLRYDRSIHLLVERRFSRSLDQFERMKQTLNEFMDVANVLRGPDFRFRFAGFQLDKTKLNEIDFNARVDQKFTAECVKVSSEYVYMKNYQLIDPGALHFIDTVYYNHLLSNVAEEIPSCFAKKFTGVLMVEASGPVPDASRFLQFLKSLNSLTRLRLENTGLGQEFYDQLPASVPSLFKFELIEDDEKEMQLNFDFISKLPRLSWFNHGSVGCKRIRGLSLESLTSLVGSFCKFAESWLNFRFRDKWFFIEKRRVWKVYGIKLLFENENPEEILNFVKAFKYELF